MGGTQHNNSAMLLASDKYNLQSSVPNSAHVFTV